MPKNNCLINRSHCKAYILEQAKLLRPGWSCTRVSGQVLDDLHHKIMLSIRGSLKRHPTIGKTFRELQ